MSQIINRLLYIIKNSPFLHNNFPDGCILVANKPCQNFKDLLALGDPHNINHDLTDVVPHQYKPCGKKCDSYEEFVTSQSNVICNAAGRKYYIRWDSDCCTQNIVYTTYCIKCRKLGFGSRISWKPRLRTYKSHAKKNVRFCNAFY